MIFTKGAHHSAKFQSFDYLGEILPNLYFDRLLLLKIKFQLKKVWRKCFMLMKSGAKFEKELIFCEF